LKIAFDENVPMGMVRVFQSLSNERRFVTTGMTIVSAKDYSPNLSDPDYLPKNDVPWLERFAKDGGVAVLSGDQNMRYVPHEMRALQQLKLTVIFFERAWSGWNFYRKSSLLLFHWQVVVKRLRTAKPGSFWCVPNHWKDGDLRKIEAPQEAILRDAPSGETKERIRKTNRPKRLKEQPKKEEVRQPELDLPAPRNQNSSRKK
jgi:hypothetical protein